MPHTARLIGRVLCDQATFGLWEEMDPEGDVHWHFRGRNGELVDVHAPWLDVVHILEASAEHIRDARYALERHS